MSQYSIFQRGDRERRALEVSGYPWAALLFSPVWAFSKGLPLQGTVLLALYGVCALSMVFATGGVGAGAAIVLWLGVYTAHNAAGWLASSCESQGFRLVGAIEAGSASQAVGAYRDPKAHRILIGSVLEKASSQQLHDILKPRPTGPAA